MFEIVEEQMGKENIPVYTAKWLWSAKLMARALNFNRDDFEKKASISYSVWGVTTKTRIWGK